MGEEIYAMDRPCEIVWQYMTMKLHQWALGQGYDGFSYVNAEEGDGDTAFVSLGKRSIKTLLPLAFDGDAFFENVAPIYETSLQLRFLKQHTKNSNVILSDIWSGIDIAAYLAPQAATKTAPTAPFAAPQA